jgi:hypothetical protein
MVVLKVPSWAPAQSGPVAAAACAPGPSAALAVGGGGILTQPCIFYVDNH